ncbi:Pyridoxal 4-dehydrogenase [Shimia sp. SK013]|uniref:aldo/keto reductase n=1 Tax=Shimia sp. SK013 TaxID=1389006 RepID=UPI0006B64FF5|nr:aldo/keto reductase [Shimia sp. SK013]KPA20286.1 Pyridoxal 4-dehydrogenase [Shimia sp. SK013]
MLNDTHRLALGTAALSGLYRPVSQSAVQDVLTTAWDNGIRFFDTAPHYGNGASESLLGDFLRDRDGWILSTKVGRLLTPDSHPPKVINGFHNAWPFKQHFDFTYDGIMRSVEDSFQRLGLNRIDILFVHDIGDPDAGTDTKHHRSQLLESGVKALEELKADGIVKAVGLGVNTVEICEELVGQFAMDLILLAGRYTLLDQSAQHRLFPLLRQHDVRLVIGGVFNSGILATGPRPGAHYNYAPAPTEVLEKVANLEAVCAQHDTALPAAAIQYPDQHPLVASTLIGTTQATSLKRNITQFNAPAPAALWKDLQTRGMIVTDQ